MTIPKMENPAAWFESALLAMLGATQWKKLTTSTRLEGYRVTATRFVCQHRAERDVTRGTRGPHILISLSFSPSISMSLSPLALHLVTMSRRSGVRTRSKEGSERASDEALYRATNPSAVTLSRFRENIAKYSCVSARARARTRRVYSGFQLSVPSLARRLADSLLPNFLRDFEAGDRYLFIYCGNSPK